jgi:hypothetical protein
LFKLYTTTFSEDPHLLVPEKDESGKKIPREEREAAIAEAAFRQLVADYPVPEDQFRLLAQRRAAAIKDRLVIANGIEEIRIYLLDAATDASAEGGEVRIQLALDAR